MSAEIVPQNFNYSFCEVYDAKWKLSYPHKSKDKKIITPPFCPLPNLDVKFCLEVFCADFPCKGKRYPLYKFGLIKMEDSITPASLKLEIEMKVCLSITSVVKEYRNLPVIIVKDMDYYYFEEMEMYDQYTYFLIDCRMKFFGHLNDSAKNNLPLVLSSLVTSSDENKHFKRSDEYSDFIIQSGSKLFLAHKSVLAHHSSIFKQMITQKSDKEAILVLEDKNCEAFDSFLDYLYLGNFEETSWPMVKDLYVLSAKYEVISLKKKCADSIVPHLSIDKVSEILKVAYDYEDINLKTTATKFTVAHIRDVISSEGWKELIDSHPRIGYDVTVNFVP